MQANLAQIAGKFFAEGPQSDLQIGVDVGPLQPSKRLIEIEKTLAFPVAGSFEIKLEWVDQSSRFFVKVAFDAPDDRDDDARGRLRDRWWTPAA